MVVGYGICIKSSFIIFLISRVGGLARNDTFILKFLSPTPPTPPTPPVAPAPTPTPGSASAAPSPQFQFDPQTGGGTPIPNTSQPVPALATAPEPPLTPVQRLRAAQASVAAEQARAAAPAPAATATKPVIPWQNNPEGPGWLDQPAGAPGRDMQNALAAQAFYGKAGVEGAPSNMMLRLMAAAGPSAARWGLKGAQTVGQVGSALELPQQVNAALPAILARILAARRASGDK